MTQAPANAPQDTHQGVAGSLRMTAKLAAMLLVSAVLMPLQALLMRFTRGPVAFVVPRFWHRCLCAILGLRVDVVGTRRSEGATLFVGNHVSHFDILALGGVLPARFLAKDDMASWPGIPFVAGLQQTVFISRRARDAGAVAAQVADVMRRGHDLVLFAEGTTSSGDTVAPFKSSLFSLVTETSPETGERRWTVQPITIELLGVDGHGLRGARDRDVYAFHGEMDAGAHVKRFLRGHGAHLRLHLHAPIPVPPDTSRKQLAAEAHAAVAAGLGRDVAADPRPECASE